MSFSAHKTGSAFVFAYFSGLAKHIKNKKKDAVRIYKFIKRKYFSLNCVRYFQAEDFTKQYLLNQNEFSIGHFIKFVKEFSLEKNFKNRE